MILRHRDRELLRFEWIGARGVRVLSVNDAERKFLPIEMAGTASDESLWKWLSHRVAPISRTNIQDPIDDPRFANVFLFDALIFNTDRHMGNFGYLVDNDTNEIVDAAPIFDNGCGLFSQAVDAPGTKGHEFDDLRLFLNRVRPACYDGWLSFPGGVTDGMRERLRKLIGFRFTPHHTHNLSVRRLREIESFLQKRVLGIIEYGDKADDLLQISANVGTINPDQGQDSLKAAIIENIRADSYVTQEELCDILEVTRSVLTKAMTRLQAEGKLLRVGSRKTGYWQVKD